MSEKAETGLRGLTRRQLLTGLAASFAASQGIDYIAGEIQLSKFRNVQSAANTVIDAIEAKLETLDAGKTLFVPVGENHARPSHRLTIQALLQGLKKRGHGIAFGFEGDYDFLAETKIPMSGEARKVSLLEQDPDGEHVLRMFSGSQEVFVNSPASLKNLFRFCLDEGVSTSFNDLAKIYGLWRGVPLDPYDPLTIHFSQYLRHDPALTFDATEPAGMGMRNVAMVFNGMAHAREEGARIYIQHCGGAHVFGDIFTNSTFAQSLTNTYRLVGADVLPVLLTRDMLDVNPDVINYRRHNPAVLFHDLDDAEFSNDWVDNSLDGEAYAAELAHMRLLTRHTDLKLYSGNGAEFQETAEMAALPITEMEADIKKRLGALGIQVDKVEIVPR